MRDLLPLEQELLNLLLLQLLLMRVLRLEELPLLKLLRLLLLDRKSTRLNSSHSQQSRMPSSA